jgi:hypothetical protein
VLSFADMLHLLPYKFACLGRRRFAFARILQSPFDCFLFWHDKLVSPQKVRLVVRWMFFTNALPAKDRKAGNLRRILDYLAKCHTLSLFDVGLARGLNTLPQRLRQFLLDQPETTDELHVVSVTLKDGRVFDDVAISQCSLVAAVRGYSHVPFDAKDVTELRVTHRRWGFGQQKKPS